MNLCKITGKRISVICISVILWGLACAFSLQKVSLVMDTEKYPVYLCVTDSIYSDTDRYAGNLICVKGIVETVKKDGSSLSLLPSDASSGIPLECTAGKKEIKQKFSSYHAGDSVLLCGKIKKAGLFDRSTVLETDSADEAAGDLPEGSYMIPGVSELTPEEISERSLRERRVTYIIPGSWQDCEHDILNENIGQTEGYHYSLSSSEHLFIIYFGNELLETENDRNKKTLIEKAIASNILKSDVSSSFPLTSKKTAYGAQYDYYQAPYRVGGIEGYSTEFVFCADGNEGFVVFLYVYRSNDRKHIPEVMTILRSLSVAE